ncbi:MAG: S8 family serine peptidase [Mojavia pulchra JT2-VF2]|jgi:subtilisin family serine protease|uniref:S8 family serine peptidase n=1 Tax=Mojavia pulchra JT2-VF2 TaxID=287848 RepID=A0A951UGS7_9NOST|nr:S8 family serine peptidase [Mojavia pulchra JT2-VF2]
MKKTFLGLFVLTLFGFASLPSLGQEQNNSKSVSPNNTNSVPGELLVQFKKEATADDKARAYGRIKAKHLEKLASSDKHSGGRGDLVLVKHQNDLPPQAAAQKLMDDPAVEFVEPNWIYTHNATSNDPYYLNGQQWGAYSNDSPTSIGPSLTTNQYGSQAEKAWSTGNTGSSTVYIGVIDEGMQVEHPDLKPNVWKNPYDPVDGIDNDGNGYVDDTNGWDFDGGNNTVYDGVQDDHGTHVAGTIGAVGGNGIGVAGVAWNVKLISVKFLGKYGGTTAKAIKAIDYITDLKTRHGLNIAATNNSWGGGGYSLALKNAIERANAANILFVAAAGNGGSDGVGDNNDLSPYYPSGYSNANIISVAAISKTGTKASFSNYGATSVDIGAPGVGIVSTLPGTNNSSVYGTGNGTSMATPHVAGAVALYAASHPSANAAQIKNAILSSAIPTTSLAGLTVTGGRLNASSF